MEERVSLVVCIIASHRLFGHPCLPHAFEFLCLCVSQERRRDLSPAEDAWSFSGLEQSLFHYGSSKTPVTHHVIILPGTYKCITNYSVFK